jgi:hypothetical protein
MCAYRPPGVYFEWQDAVVSTLPRIRSDVAALVGIAHRGPLHEPRLVESWDQFTSIFGGHLSHAHLAYAAEGFFRNGGRSLWAVRVADPDTARPASAVLYDGRGRPTLRLRAKHPGTGGRDISFTIQSAGSPVVQPTAQDRPQSREERFTLVLRLEGVVQEVWQDLSMWPHDEDPDDPHYVVEVLNRSGGSQLVEAIDLNVIAFRGDSTPVSAEAGERQSHGRLDGGDDGLTNLRPGHFTGRGMAHETWGLKTLENIGDVSIVAVPDAVRVPEPFPTTSPCDDPQEQKSRTLPRAAAEDAPSPATDRQGSREPFSEEEIEEIQRALLAHCESNRYRFAVLDLPWDRTLSCRNVETVAAWRKQFRSPFGAIYHPWLRVRARNEADVLRVVPPSGHVAGLIARVDRSIGVGKPPANEVLEGVQDVTIRVDEPTHGQLNDQHVNVIRVFPGRGLRVFGARTLAPRRSQWRFVNVRRLVSTIEKTLETAANALVFAGNLTATWIEMDRVVRSVLHQFWLDGLLEGATPDEAYQVRCDETTNTPADLADGRLNCVVELQPPAPAERVVIRMGRVVNTTQFQETVSA